MKPLDSLADIAVPAPAPWIPQTWGWAVLGVALLAFAVWAFVSFRRRQERNRYRKEALAELASFSKEEAVLGIPNLLKRVALSAWPRAEVAALSGEAWVSFLRAHGPFSHEAARLLDDMEYRPRAAPRDEDVQALMRAARAWIQRHVRA